MKLKIESASNQIGVEYAKIQIIQAGTVGPPGPGAATHTHDQATPSVEWIVNHNFGVNPIIEVLSPGGQAVTAEIVHISPNQARIYFNTPQTGKAIAR